MPFLLYYSHIVCSLILFFVLPVIWWIKDSYIYKLTSSDSWGISSTTNTSYNLKTRGWTVLMRYLFSCHILHMSTTVKNNKWFDFMEFRIHQPCYRTSRSISRLFWTSYYKRIVRFWRIFRQPNLTSDNVGWGDPSKFLSWIVSSYLHSGRQRDRDQARSDEIWKERQFIQ